MEAMELARRPPRGHHRVGRLQRPRLSHALAGADRRRRPQHGAHRAEPPEARGGRAPALAGRPVPLLRRGRQPHNSRAYDRFLAPHLDAATRALLGKAQLARHAGASRSSSAISTAPACSACSSPSGHRVARLYGVDPAGIMKARTIARAAPLLRGGAGAALRPPADALVAVAKVLAVRPRHPAGAVRFADHRPATARWRSVLSARLEKLACDFPLNDNYFAWQAFARRYPAPGEGALPAYLDKAQLRDDPRAMSAASPIHHVNITELLGSKPAAVGRPLRPARRAGLDDRRASSTRCGPRSPAPPRPAPASSSAPRPSRALLPGRVVDALLDAWDYARGRIAALLGARPLGDLWRLPSLCEERPDERGRRAAQPCRADGRRLPLSAPCLRPHPQILPARPRPADRRPRRAARTARCWNSAAAPAATWCWPPRLYPDARSVRPRHFRRDAGDGGRCHRWRERPVGARHAGAGRRDGFRRATLFGRPSFDRIFISYALSMIPGGSARSRRRSTPLDAGRLAAHRRFRPAGAPAGWFRNALRAWLAKFHVTPRDTLREVLESECRRIGASLRFEIALSRLCGPRGDQRGRPDFAARLLRSFASAATSPGLVAELVRASIRAQVCSPVRNTRISRPAHLEALHALGCCRHSSRKVYHLSNAMNRISTMMGNDGACRIVDRGDAAQGDVGVFRTRGRRMRRLAAQARQD